MNMEAELVKNADCPKCKQETLIINGLYVYHYKYPESIRCSMSGEKYKSESETKKINLKEILEANGVESDINKRWENGIPHHPKSLELMKFISDADFELCSDYFCWKMGGDGDNGETLMYEMDLFFELKDKKEERRLAW